MTKVKPFIKCVDCWPVQIPPEKLQIYKQLIEEGQILKHHVVFNQKTGSTTVEYSSIVLHEWILDEMRRRANGRQG